MQNKTTYAHEYANNKHYTDDNKNISLLRSFSNTNTRFGFVHVLSATTKCKIYTTKQNRTESNRNLKDLVMNCTKCGLDSFSG